jgi:nucleotide-binding universal stress UspA family protein
MNRLLPGEVAGSGDPERPLRSLDDAGVRDRSDTILLPVGPSDGDRVGHLVDTAAEVAGMMEARVRVLHVFTPPRFRRVLERSVHDPDAPPDPDEVAPRVEPVGEALRRLDAPLWNWGTTMTVEGRLGDRVSDEIVAAAAAVDAKRILVGGRQRTPTGKAVYGSTAQEVMLDATCPVTFVRDG